MQNPSTETRRVEAQKTLNYVSLAFIIPALSAPIQELATIPSVNAFIQQRRLTNWLEGGAK